jgi:hypothetical protein
MRAVEAESDITAKRMDHERSIRRKKSLVTGGKTVATIMARRAWRQSGEALAVG